MSPIKAATTSLAAVVLLSLAACSGDSNEGTADDPSPSLSISSDPSSGPSEAEDLPEGVPTSPPQRPEDVKSIKGAEAFARYVAEVFWYTQLTNNSETLQSLIPAKTQCDSCQDEIRRADKERSQGRVARPRDDLGLRNPAAVEPLDGSGGTWSAKWEIWVPASTMLDTESGKKLGPVGAFGRWLRLFVDMRWDGQQWTLKQYQLKEL